MPFLETRTVRVLTTTLIYAVVLGFIWYARYMLVAFLLGLLFAYILEPLVPWVQKGLRLPRNGAITVIYAALVFFVALLLFRFGPVAVHQIEHLDRDLPGLTQRLASGALITHLGQTHGWSPRTQAELTTILTQHRGTMVEIEHEVTNYVTAFIKNIWWFGLIPLLSVFFLVSGETLGRGIIDLARRRARREFLDSLLSDLHDVWGHFIRSQLILMLIAIVVYIGFLSLIGMPYSLAIGLAAGLFEFIPTLGPIIAAALILGAAFGFGFGHLILLIVFLAVWRVEQDYVNAPKIMGSRLNIHPFLVIFAVLTGAEIAGILGVFLSVPIVASLRVFWLRWQAFDAGRYMAPVTPSASGPQPPLAP